MGNCCPCVKSESITRSSVAPGNYSLSTGKPEESGNTTFNCSVDFPVKYAWFFTDTNHHTRIESDEPEDSSFISDSNRFVNGSGLDSRDAKGIEIHRPFYVLIPPLAGRGNNTSGKIFV